MDRLRSCCAALILAASSDQSIAQAGTPAGNESRGPVLKSSAERVTADATAVHGDSMPRPDARCVCGSASIGSTTVTRPDGSTISDPTLLYGPLALIVGNNGGGNAGFFSVYNARGGVRFPTAVTGRGELAIGAAGSQAFGGYFEAVTRVPGVVSTELDAFNFGAAAPTRYPWDRSIGTTATIPVAETCAAGGPSTNAACLEISREGATKGRFAFGIVQQKDAVVQAGIYQDADPLVSPVNNAVLRNTGQGGHVSVVLQTVGPSAGANPVFEHLDARGLPTVVVTQDGSQFVGADAGSDGAGPATCISGGHVASAGHNQGCRRHMQAVTVGASSGALTIGGMAASATTQLPVGDRSVMQVHAMVTARIPLTGAGAAWTCDGLFRRANGSRSTTKIGAPACQPLGSDHDLSNARVTILADQTDDVVRIGVVGVTDATIHWGGLIDTVQVQ